MGTMLPLAASGAKLPPIAVVAAAAAAVVAGGWME